MEVTEDWPTDKLNALRLGQRLVAEAAASRAGRRAFIDIRPERKPDDIKAAAASWRRADPTRSFVVQHWEYAEEHLGGHDYDVGAKQIASMHAADEEELRAVIRGLGLTPSAFSYPWRSDDPR